MVDELRIGLEVGPRGKGVAAVALDWPGLERGATTREGALETLVAYRARYAPIAEAVGLAAPFAAQSEPRVHEEYEGTGSTDFWRISFAFSKRDDDPMTPEELERDAGVLRACWAYFDDVRARVSEQLRKGPRGGGRDRERIVQHVTNAERSWARKLGVRYPDVEGAPDPSEEATYRRDYVTAIASARDAGERARTWPLRFLIRHSAYHVLDHAWEMQDKDLGGSS